MSIPRVQPTSQGTAPLDIPKQTTLKQCSKIILKIALAALSISAGALAAFVGFIPAVFAVTGIYGAVSFGILGTALTGMLTHYLFINSFISKAQNFSSKANTSEDKSPIGIVENGQNKLQGSLEEFYKSLRERCRIDLQHTVTLFQKVFYRADQRKSNPKFTEDQQKTYRSMAWITKDSKPATQNEKELARSYWETIYSHYDKIVIRSLRIHTILVQQEIPKDSLKSALHNPDYEFQSDEKSLKELATNYHTLRVKWMRAVQNVEKIKIELELLGKKPKRNAAEIQKYTAELPNEIRNLANKEKEMDELDSKFVKGELEYGKYIQELPASLSAEREMVGA